MPKRTLTPEAPVKPAPPPKSEEITKPTIAAPSVPPPAPAKTWLDGSTMSAATVIADARVAERAACASFVERLDIGSEAVRNAIAKAIREQK